MTLSIREGFLFAWGGGVSHFAVSVSHFAVVFSS